MKRALLLMIVLAACGDDHPKAPGDAGADSPVVMPDAPTTAATLTSFVIDLVQHHTNASDSPRPYSDFSGLPDPDGSNASAYAPLF